MPYRYFVGDWISSGNFPEWNPYQLLGYPIHADPQSGAWYPVTWFFSIGGYSFSSLNWELWFHFMMAGMGAYFFFRTTGSDKTVSAFLGMVYMMSGFFVGNAQVMVIIIGATWMPWSLAFLIRSVRFFKFKWLFLAAVVNYLALSGSYPASTVVLVYVHLGLFIYYIVQFVRGNIAFKSLTAFPIIATVTLLLGTGYLKGFFEMADLLSRSEPLPYIDYYYGAVGFNFECWFSFLSPYTTVTQDFYSNDLTFRNAYIGVIPLTLAAIALVKIKGRERWWLYVGVLFIAFLAAGMQTPFHKLFYDYLPGFDHFRHTGLLRFYLIFILLIGIGIWIKEKGSTLSINHLPKSVWIFTLALFSMLFITGLVSTDYSAINEFVDHAIHLREGSPLNFGGHLAINAFIQLLIIFWIIYQTSKNRLTARKIIMVVFIDLFVAIQLCAPTNLYYNKLHSEYRTYESTLPDELTNQRAGDNLKLYGDDTDQKRMPSVWRNLGTYNKTTSHDGYNPFHFKTLSELREDTIFQNVLNNPVAYGENIHLREMEIIRKGFILKIESTTASVLNISQNYHDNWSAKINGKETELQRANISLMQLKVPKGSSELILKYSSSSTTIGLITFLVVICSGLIILIITEVRTRKKPVREL